MNNNENMLPVSFSGAALREIQYILKEKNIPFEYGLRVGIQGGGCAGVSFIIGFDKSKSNDKIYELENLKIFIQKKDIMFLLGTEIDFEDNAEAKGFVFNTPG
jgi:iron-sulfur cluster assembly protein